MNNKPTGIDLLKRNFDRVEEKHLDFFESGEPRWPTENRDYLHNHHQPLSQFLPVNVSLEKLKVNALPDEIFQEVQAAFEAFKNGEEYV